uniref:CASP-like protein n=1 Tax=Fagus sylvatica TaxID=28930 RepID=A0A2N9I4Y8_FAGSY
MADFLVLLVLVSSLFASAGAAVDHFVMESIVTNGQREGPAFFSWFLVSVAGAAADRFVTEFAVDRWVIHRGPLGGVEDQPPSSFLGFG